VYAVIGSVKIKPGHEQETLAMIEQGGVAMLRGFPGSRGGYWARTVDGEELVQHSFWLFDDEKGARAAESTYHTLREMPDAPATFISVEVCEVVGEA
jgi:antibiotic biosynthesis monooxygenase (ABM) superfamily enzyme